MSELQTHENKRQQGAYSADVVPAPVGDDGYAVEREDEELAKTHQGEFGTKRDLVSLINATAIKSSLGQYHYYSVLSTIYSDGFFDLKPPRVVSMIAIAGTIGTGLFLGSGGALATGGPVGFWLGYTFIGLSVGCMMMCLGEMSVFAPNVGGMTDMGNKYVDPAMGFMMGINYILQVGLAIPAEMSAIAVMIGYWDTNTAHVPIYIAVFLVVCIAINIVGVRYFGEVEFVFAISKSASPSVFLIRSGLSDLGGVPPKHEFIGGRYWRDEPFNDTYLDLQPISKARFLGFWAVLTKAAFSYGGIEGISVLAGEAHNPRKTMKMAVKTVFYRIVGIYMLSTLIIGLNISQKSPDLLTAVALGGGTAASSPFVVICKQTGVKVLPSIINAVVMTSALSASNENVYATSRTLMALARQRAMPKIFLKTSKAGIPLAGVAVSFCFGLLAFLSVSSGSNQGFIWLSNLSALSSLVAWISICICYIRFKKALKAQGINRNDLTFRSWFQPYLAWYCVIFFSVILLFNGFASFIGGFNISNFFASYVTLPVIALCFIGWKVVKKTKITKLEEIDLSMGPQVALRGTKHDLGATRYETYSREKE
uniref:Amino acid permease/ SLC12A domain-containing protein n=1 Tax=Kwoniella dejecticola CBS 10117 TaxID=1296121 RepID=A0A1A6A3Y9_9TREE|nr:uncharacterized protein I303_05632 [Kwoniella dejecticola CBS 10117]OBR84773.1 hypothetical protein I303_05632 [Kwoniella dejecticola CBS 10117]